jgi:hypothetical protein
MGLFTSGPVSEYPVLVTKEEQKRKRVQFQESLRREHWTLSPALSEFKSWRKKCEKRFEETVTLLWQANFLQKQSWTKRWLIRVPTIVILRILALSLSLAMGPIFLLLIYPVMTVLKLSMTYFRFRRTSSKELAKFDQRVKDEQTRALWEVEMKEKIREREKQLRIDRENKREYEQSAKQLVGDWIKECQTFSSETLLEHWALLQQFPVDHYIYIMLEGSPGPIIREIVDREVENRAISIEARQLALLRFENKRASLSQARITQEIAAAQRDAQESQLGLMNGFMAMALIHLYKQR